MGIYGEVIGVVRFDGLCMFMMFVGLRFNKVSVFIKGDGVACVSRYFCCLLIICELLRRFVLWVRIGWCRFDGGVGLMWMVVRTHVTSILPPV